MVILAALALFGTGCASIVHSGARTLNITSDPAGAKVTICKIDTTSVVAEGTTPYTVALSARRGYFKGQSYNVKFELQGYKTAEIVVRHELSGWYFGNIIFGGLIGMIAVDPATGAMWNLAPDKIEQKLSAGQASIIHSKDGFLVVLISEVTASEKANLTRIN